MLIGRYTERKLDSLNQLSYVKLNKGDEKIISNFEKNNRWMWAWSAVGVALVFIEGILINVASAFLLKWYFISSRLNE